MLAGLIQGPDGPLSDLLEAGDSWLPGLLFLSTFASEDLACVAGGMLVAEERVSFAAATLGCALGIWLSDLGLYGLGWAARRGLLGWSRLRRRVAALQSGRLARGFNSHGIRIVLVSRCIPGSRVPCYIAAGAVGWSFPRFALALSLGAAVWTPLAVAFGAVVGQAAFDLFDGFGQSAWLAVPLALLLAWLALRLIESVTSWRGRRLWRARWRRWVAWEYWPTWLVYLPVVLDQVRIAVVRRTPTSYASCNPAIPHGGLVLESKGDILDLLPGAGDAAVQVAPYRRLRRETPLDERLAMVAAWLEPAGVVVLKPDEGERGAGVAMIRSLEHARLWLEQCPYDALLQEYARGEEYGVVWRRKPDRDGPGELRSVAHKRLPPPLRGDGDRSIEELILSDGRQSAMFRHYRRMFGSRLVEVPAAGELVVLGELGTHCRGASFHDARELMTDALRDALDRFMADSPGLDFGRFDVLVPSPADLAAGHGLRVLELNGVTGEPAHVYQPGYPVRRGLAEIVAHWRAACETGAANRAAGRAGPESAWRLARMLWAMRWRPGFEAPPAP